MTVEFMVPNIQPGVIVIFNNLRYKIKLLLSLEKVLIESLDSGEAISASLSDLQPDGYQNIQANEQNNVKATIEFTEQEWKEAKKREKAIQPFASIVCSRNDAEHIGSKLGISTRYVYKLIRRYQASGGKLASLLPHKRNGGAGRSRLNKSKLLKDY